jgi:hypothetical protein
MASPVGHMASLSPLAGCVGVRRAAGRCRRNAPLHPVSADKQTPVRGLSTSVGLWNDANIGPRRLPALGIDFPGVVVAD